MARARNIKPGFFRNAELVELPFETRLLFIGLWTLADREGRLEDRPKQIKMEIFPADQCDVGSMLDQLCASGFISRYEVDGDRFIEVLNFIKHQDPHYKEKASEIPPPSGKENFIKATGVTRKQRQRILERDQYVCQSCGATEHLCIDHIMPVSRGGDSSDENLQTLCGSCNTKKGNKINGEDKNSRQRRVNVDPNLNQRNDALPSDSLIPDSLIPDSLNLIPESTTLAPDKPDADIKPAKTARRACQLPADFYPNKTGVEYADARSISFATELESFRNWHSAKGTTMKDWQAAWRTWCDKAVTYGRTSAGPPARASPAQARYEAGMEVVDVLTGRGNSSGRERVITGEVIGITRAVGG